MRYEDFGIQIPFGKVGGTVKTKCPQCGSKSGHANRKDLSVNISEGVWKCHSGSCGWSGSIKTKIKDEKIYQRPSWKNNTELSEKAVKWFEKRGISQFTLREMKIYTDKVYMPQYNKEVDVICFPYFRDGELINIKYRTY